jgi:hypothetical protein
VAIWIYFACRLFLPFNYGFFDLSLVGTSHSLNTVIPFATVRLNDGLTLIFVFSFFLSFFLSLSSIGHTKEIEFLCLTRVSMQDVIFAKFIQIFKEILKFVFPFVISVFVLYWANVFVVTRTIMMPWYFVIMNLSYFFIGSMTFFLFVLATFEAGFLISLLIHFVLYRFKARLDFSKLGGSFYFFLILIMCFLFSFLILSLFSFQEGGAPVSTAVMHFSFLTMGIAGVSRPVLNFTDSIKALLILAAAMLILSLLIYYVSSQLRGFSLLEERRHKAVGRKRTYAMPFLKTLPLFMKKDLTVFFRGGKSLHWALTGLAQGFLLVLFVIIPLFYSKANNGLNFYGVTYKFYAPSLLIICIRYLADLYLYLYDSEQKSIYLIKLAPLKLSSFIMLKFLSAAIISLPVLILVVFLIFSKSVSADSSWHLMLTIIQIFILFEWYSVENCYVALLYSNFNAESFFDFRGMGFGKKQSFEVLISFSLLVIWIFAYRFAFNLPGFLSILIIIAEIALPVLPFILILRKTVSRIERLELT